MFRQPFSELLKTIPVPERVYQALADQEGPYQPYARLVQAMEGSDVFEIKEAADQLMMSFGDINRAVLAAMTSASQLD